VVQPEDIMDNLDDDDDDVEALAVLTDDSTFSHGNTNKGTAAAAAKVDTETETEKYETVMDVETGMQHATGADAEADENDADGDTANTKYNVEAAMSDVNEDECDTGYLVLRGGNTQTQQQQQKRKVPNGCAICLGPYEVGEVVVWSSNAACQHAFHEECMVDWLCKMVLIQSQNRDSTPCPCCRQEFTDLETYRKEKKIATPRDTFNPQLVRL
jgi:hypothetical protein